MYVTIYCSYACCQNKFTLILDGKYTILVSLIGFPKNIFTSLNLYISYNFFSRWVVYYTYKTLFILYLQTHETWFSLSRSWKNYIFLPALKFNAKTYYMSEYSILLRHTYRDFFPKTKRNTPSILIPQYNFNNIYATYFVVIFQLLCHCRQGGGSSPTF